MIRSLYLRVVLTFLLAVTFGLIVAFFCDDVCVSGSDRTGDRRGNGQYGAGYCRNLSAYGDFRRG